MAKHSRQFAKHWRDFHPRLRVAKRRRSAALRGLRAAHVRMRGRHNYCALSVVYADRLRRYLRGAP